MKPEKIQNNSDSDSDYTLKWFHIFLLSLFLQGYGVRFLQVVGKDLSSTNNNSESLENTSQNFDLSYEQVIKFYFLLIQ